MAAVYKALSKSAHDKDDAPADGSSSVKPRNKQRVLMLTSRGVTYRHRHLLKDLASMMPHGRVDAKYDQKKRLGELNELAVRLNCIIATISAFLKLGKVKLSKAPNGPTCKFLVSNIHTMEELAFSGNCLKGSRPILSFDKTFDTEPHLQVIKQLFLQIMGVPPLQKRSKPFIDHVLSFSVADGRIFLRVYQVQETETTKKDGADGEEVAEESKKRKSKHADQTKELDISLLEIGPRCVLQPIIIQEGSFGGALLYENKHFVSPNQVRADLRRKGAAKGNSRAEQNISRKSKMGNLGLRTDGDQKPVDQLDSRELFA
ncbi:hypothetical protein NPX13_g5629 [Xylaria arbuscula]|uniref:Brix domain-containing protein n=1 Tax=Xylaria arbuscula TaxID=114810 RepID=A0A9W8NE26_9PEZI|nr:hypothetical protein NPX13_g5629 [Xylaria arbuscula]